LYNYPHYKEKDIQKVISFMRENPFAMIIGSGKDHRIELTQVPIMVDEREGKLFLSGHIARKSDHEKAFEENPSVLVVFTSPHTYVSGAWYTGNPQQASTWNYISIHARGTIRWMLEDELRQFLQRLTLHYEKNNTGSSTVYDNLPSEYVEKLIKAIIGFEFEVTELDNVHKLSQNRDEKSYLSIIEELEKRDAGAQYIAGKMKENTSKVFKKQ
jgi:transcriptional regulator